MTLDVHRCGGYVITAKRRGDELSRRAVATLDEAIERVAELAHGNAKVDDEPVCAKCRSDAREHLERFGPVITLPDGTVIEVAHDA